MNVATFTNSDIGRSTGIINEHFLRYNFQPKLEWPDED